MSDLTHSFILPAYNESERLTTSIPKVLEYVQDRGLHAEIIVVNDGSTDKTAEVVRGFAATNPMIELLENPGNRGKGYSVRNGMLHAKGVLGSCLPTPTFRHRSPKPTSYLQRWPTGLDVAIGSRWLQARIADRAPAAPYGNCMVAYSTSD